MIASLPLWSALDERRRALQMSRSLLARRAGVPLRSVNRILDGPDHAQPAARLHALAVTLGLRIQLEPAPTIAEVCDATEFRRQNARTKASHLVALVQGTMALEAQGVDAQTLANLVEYNTQWLLAGPPSQLWDE